MLGYRRVNLGLANELYSSEVSVEFIKVEEDSIGQLMHALKNLKNSVKTYYEYDHVLIEETEQFISICRKSVGSILNYSIFFKANNEQIVKYFSLTKKAIYADLFKNNIVPIIDLIKFLRKQDHNAYINTLISIENRKQINSENTYLLTKYETMDKFIAVNESKIRVMTVKEFIEEGIFADQIIFLGTSSYFDRKFSEIFYGKHIIFLGYSCFENRLIQRKSFSNIINQNELINTIYKGVEFDKGYSGIDFKETFLTIDDKKSEEAVINQFQTTEDDLEKVEVKLATISHNNYIFLPVNQNVNVINRETLKITQEKVRNLTLGNLLVFRTQNASDLVKEIADKILSNNAKKYRDSLEKWKKRLRLYVKRKGIERVSKILTDRYHLDVAKENNIKNWMSSYSIKPSRLNELLKAFKFDSHDIEEIMNASQKIYSAHISAGHQISHALMNELDGSLESIIEENGFYTFESKEFEGASFNIEEIKKISSETYSIPENEALKIIKG